MPSSCRRLLPSANSGTRRVNWQIAEPQGGDGLANRARKTRALGYGCAADHLPKRLEELTGELFRGRVDQPAAELRQLAADLCIDFVSEDRGVSAISGQLDRRSALGKAGGTTGAFAGDAVAVRRVEIGQRNLAAEGRLHRADLEHDRCGHLVRRSLLQRLAAGNALPEDFRVV